MNIIDDENISDVNDVTKNQLLELKENLYNKDVNLCENVDEVNDNVKHIMNSIGTRKIIYPNKQIRSDKQLFSFYTGYANRLNSILLKTETNYRLKQNKIKKKLKSVMNIKNEYEKKTTMEYNLKEKKLMKHYKKKIIKEEEAKNTEVELIINNNQPEHKLIKQANSVYGTNKNNQFRLHFVK